MYYICDTSYFLSMEEEQNNYWTRGKWREDIQYYGLVSKVIENFADEVPAIIKKARVESEVSK